MRKKDFAYCENKGTGQLSGRRTADLRLCFRVIDSKIHLSHKPEISSLKPYNVAVQPGLCGT